MYICALEDIQSFLEETCWPCHILASLGSRIFSTGINNVLKILSLLANVCADISEVNCSAEVCRADLLALRVLSMPFLMQL